MLLTKTKTKVAMPSAANEASTPFFPEDVTDAALEGLALFGGAALTGAYVVAPSAIAAGITSSSRDENCYNIQGSIPSGITRAAGPQSHHLRAGQHLRSTAATQLPPPGSSTLDVHLHSTRLLTIHMRVLQLPGMCSS